jgi:hypothetical protein
MESLSVDAVSKKATSTYQQQQDSLDAYLTELESFKARLLASDHLPSPVPLNALHKSTNAQLQDASKEYYNVLNKFNKAVDKVLPKRLSSL